MNLSHEYTHHTMGVTWGVTMSHGEEKRTFKSLSTWKSFSPKLRSLLSTCSRNEYNLIPYSKSNSYVTPRNEPIISQVQGKRSKMPKRTWTKNINAFFFFSSREIKVPTFFLWEKVATCLYFIPLCQFFIDCEATRNKITNWGSYIQMHT